MSELKSKDYVFVTLKNSYRPKGRKKSVADTNAAVFWSEELNGMRADQITAGCSRHGWFLCSQGHKWASKICSATRGIRCPHCYNAKQTKFSDTDKAHLWNNTLNGMTADCVTSGSSKKAWFTCDKGHDWEAVVFCISRGNGCPHCHKAKQTMFSDTDKAHLWSTELNKKSADNIPSGSSKRAWFICPNGHKWNTIIYSVSRGTGCPQCYIDENTWSLPKIYALATSFQSKHCQTPCLLWPEDGPKRIMYQKRGFSPYGLASFLDTGKILPEGFVRRHLCGQGRCVFAKHIRYGTAQENSDDMITHGTVCWGSRNGNSKLSDQHIKEIHGSKEKGRVLAARYGISVHHANKIKARKSGGPSLLGKRKAEELSDQRRRQRKARIANSTETAEEAAKRILKNTEEVNDVVPNDASVTLRTPCRRWKGFIDKAGYGIITMNGRPARVHRVVEMAKPQGPMDTRTVTRHLCRLKACCEPTHLTRGSCSENTIDRIKAGKSSKLSIDQVKLIFINAQNLSRKERGKLYNVSTDAIRGIDTKRTWKWLTDTLSA